MELPSTTQSRKGKGDHGVSFMNTKLLVFGGKKKSTSIGFWHRVSLKSVRSSTGRILYHILNSYERTKKIIKESLDIRAFDLRSKMET